MEINKINYHFIVRDVEDTALQLLAINKNVSCPDINRTKITQALGVKFDMCQTLQEMIRIIKPSVDSCEDAFKTKALQLEYKWDKAKYKVFQEVSAILDFKQSDSVSYNIYCKLHNLPINELRHNGEIYLDGNETIDELFEQFVIQVIKHLVLIKLEILIGRGHYKFETTNKVAMFLDIVIDAIFANGDLSAISKDPSYKYFYSLKIKGVNVMQKFRELYKLIPIEDLFQQVYEFVYYNHKTLLNFKSYLY